jgi:hypothetical protein
MQANDELVNELKKTKELMMESFFAEYIKG